MVKTGLEKFIGAIKQHRKRRIALIVNQTSVTRGFEYIWEVLRKEGVDIRRVFSPEHGLFAVEQDQVAVSRQPQLPFDMVSLYGDSYGSLAPDESLLDDIDLVLFDMQDAGCRYYTYVNTMALFMEKISGRSIELMVLDRPNPLGGMLVEGPLLGAGFESFVGIMPVAVVHGLTPGELSLLYRDAKGLNVRLTVIAMDGWSRKMRYRDTRLPWVPPSPNMPTEETAYRYPGICLIEGSNVSEGRGTALPFMQAGAPFVNPFELADHLASMKIPGVAFRPVFFRPQFNKFQGETSGGVYLHVTDIDEFRPFFTGVALVKALCDLYGGDVLFRDDVYEFNREHPAFDLLTGNSVIREMILEGCSLPQIRESWIDDEREFARIREEYQLYGY